MCPSLSCPIEQLLENKGLQMAELVSSVSRIYHIRGDMPKIFELMSITVAPVVRWETIQIHKTKVTQVRKPDTSILNSANKDSAGIIELDKIDHVLLPDETSHLLCGNGRQALISKHRQYWLDNRAMTTSQKRVMPICFPNVDDQGPVTPRLGFHLPLVS